MQKTNKLARVGNDGETVEGVARFTIRTKGFNARTPIF
jgi:hypothetical protein